MIRLMRSALLLLTVSIFTALYAGEFRIIATADLHGDLASLAKLAPVLRNTPAELRIDIGDLVQGQVASDFADGQPMIGALHSLKFNIFIPGNHEFELGGAALTRLCKSFNGTVLGGNWSSAGYRPAAWKIFRKDKFSCAVIGLSEEFAGDKVLLMPDFTITPLAISLRRALDEIRPHRVNAVILVWHNGLRTGRKSIGSWLWEFPEIDAVIASHTHAPNPGMRAARGIAAQMGARAESAVLLTIRFNDSSGAKQLITTSLLRPAKFPDPEIANIRTRAEEAAAHLYRIPLEKFNSQEDFSSRCAGILLRTTGCDAVIFDHPAYLDPAKLSAGRFYQLYPYRNRICKLTVPAATISLLQKERVPGRRIRRIIFAPGSKNKSMLQLAATDFQINSSPALRQFRRRAIVTPLIKRELILRELIQNE